MFHRLRRPVFAAALCLLPPAWAPPAGACAFDGGAAASLFDGRFEALYPQASTVYFAIVDAIDQGVLETAAFQPVTPGPTGYWRAVGRLDSLARRLSAATVRVPAMQAISIVLIESNLWARFEPDAQGFAMTAHTSGPRPGDVTIVTSEGGIAAVLDGRLPVRVALERGLIAIDADPDAAQAARELVLAALDGAEAAPTGARNAPARLFGPTR